METRFKMLVVWGQHWYVYEPVHLFNLEMVVSFFFKEADAVEAKCLTINFGWAHSGNELVMSFPEEVAFELPVFSTVEFSPFKTPYSEIFLELGDKLLGCLFSQGSGA